MICQRHLNSGEDTDIEFGHWVQHFLALGPGQEAGFHAHRTVRFYVVPYWEVVAVMVTTVADGVGVGTVGEVIVVVAEK